MSKVVKYTGQLSNFVHYKDKYFYIDSRRTLDSGLEMMVFPANCFCEVTDWGNVLYEEHFEDIADMIARHTYLRNHIEEVLPELAIEGKFPLRNYDDKLESFIDKRVKITWENEGESVGVLSHDKSGYNTPYVLYHVVGNCFDIPFFKSKVKNIEEYRLDTDEIISRLDKLVLDKSLISEISAYFDELNQLKRRHEKE